MNLSSTIIVVEGCDGAGKTTLIEHLAKYLRETLKLDVSTLKFPGRQSTHFSIDTFYFSIHIFSL